MFNTEYALTQEKLTTMMQFSHVEALELGETIYYMIPPKLDWAPMLFDLWNQISGVVTNSWDELLASHINIPIIRYFFKIISNTIFGRFHNNEVNLKELFFLH